MTKRLFVVVALTALVFSACNGSPSAPSPTPPAPTTYIVGATTYTRIQVDWPTRVSYAPVVAIIHVKDNVTVVQCSNPTVVVTDTTWSCPGFIAQIGDDYYMTVGDPARAVNPTGHNTFVDGKPVVRFAPQTSGEYGVFAITDSNGSIR